MYKFKIGDIITSEGFGQYIGKIEKIENNLIWCFWSYNPVSCIPKTMEEFNNILKDEDISYINSYDCKLLELSVPQEFKVGDKVKIPKTKTAKSQWSDILEHSTVVINARELNQEYLFITKIYKEENEYVLDYILSGTGDIFSINDLERYEENKEVKEESKYIKFDKPTQITEQILRGKIKYSVKGNKTTVKFNDGREGFSKCSPEDEFSLYTGLAMAIGRAIYGQDVSVEYGDKKLKDYTNQELIDELASRLK